MYWLLGVEEHAKYDGGLTPDGFSAYIIYHLAMARSGQMKMDEVLYGFSAIEVDTGLRINPTTIGAVWD
jgi:hypothetical protein